MPSYSMNHIIHSDETEVPGMKILYADKSEPGCVTYINDVVYDVRSGVPLHLQMLYPDVPAALMEKREAEQQAEQVGKRHTGVDKIRQFPDQIDGLNGAGKYHHNIKNLVGFEKKTFQVLFSWNQFF